MTAAKRKMTVAIGIRYLFWYLVSIPFARFVTIRKDRVILASNRGEGFSGNVRYLFEIWQREGNFDVWAVVSSKKIYQELSERYDNVLFMFSWKAIRIITRARFFIITHGRLDIPFSRFRKTIIQTWHGIPFKAIGFSCNERLKDKISNLLYKWFDYNSIDYFLSSSSYVTQLYCGVFRQKQSKFLEIGFPRNDIFQMDRKKLTSCFYSLLKEKVPVFEKVILYAPTYRPYPSTYFPFPDCTENYNSFKRLLSRKKSVCLVKSHVNQRYKLDVQLAQSNRIIDISSDSRFPDLQEILPEVDILITDYSSVSIDALLLDLPCIYINSDMEEYIHATGEFCCDYSSLAAGVHIRSMADLIEALKDLLDGDDIFKEERYSALKLFFSPSSYSSTEKLTSFMKELISDKM